MSTTGDPDLAGAFAGERIFLIGNGPSLAETPLDALEDEYTMAMNKIDLIYDAVTWRPDFYICTHPWESISSHLPKSIQIHDDIDSTHLFLDAELRGLVSTPASDVTFLNVNYMGYLNEENPMNTDTATVREADRSWLDKYWSYDISEVVWNFHTMYVAAQISLWMGFDEIYFVGADVNYSDPIHMPISNGIDPVSFVGNKWEYFRVARREKKLFSAVINGVTTKLLHYVVTMGLTNVVLGPSTNHFSPSYQSHTIFGNANADIKRSHMIIKRICESEGVLVRNATLGGELEIYERVDLTNVLRSS